MAFKMDCSQTQGRTFETWVAIVHVTKCKMHMNRADTDCGEANTKSLIQHKIKSSNEKDSCTYKIQGSLFITEKHTLPLYRFSWKWFLRNSRRFSQRDLLIYTALIDDASWKVIGHAFILVISVCQHLLRLTSFKIKLSLGKYIFAVN